MEDRKVRFGDPFVDSLSEAHWNVIITPASPYKKSIKHRDIVATTMDRWIELLVKENLIKQYQAETLRIIASDPGIPIGYYHRPQKFSLLPQSKRLHYVMNFMFLWRVSFLSLIHILVAIGSFCHQFLSLVPRIKMDEYIVTNNSHIGMY